MNTNYTPQEIMEGIAELYKEWSELKSESEGCTQIRLPEFESAMKELAEKIGTTWTGNINL